MFSPMHIRFRVNKDGKALQVISFIQEHNYELLNKVSKQG